MQSKSRRALLVLLGTGLALGISACAGKYCQRKPEQQAAWLIEKVTDELELNSGQQASFRLFVDELTEGRKQMQQQRKQGRESLMVLLSQDSFDRKKSLQMVERHMEAMQSHAPRLVNSFGDFYDKLSPAQRKELREELSEHLDHHHRKHHW